MGDDKRRIVIRDVSGGRNGYLPPNAIADNELADAVNVDFYRTNFTNKRPGAVSVSTGASTFAGVISWLYRHVPGTSQGAAELWGVDDSSPQVFQYIAGGSSWASITSGPVANGNPWEISAASINGKIILGYKTTVARLKAGIGSGSSLIRYTGLAASAAPTAADGGGAGAYAAILRYYRQRYTIQSGGVTIRRSEPSASVAFTPSGANLNATVTKAATISESETHWELEVSLDNITFYRIATTVVGTTTYADTAVVTTYNTNPLSAATGVYTLQKPYRFVAADENRVLGYSSFTSTDKQSRIEFSAVIGSLDVGDEERVDTTTNYFLDLDELDSGIPTGLAGPVNGTFFAFKDRQVWQLSPTGQTSQPYLRRAISKTIGALGFQAIARAEDEQGNPALYWMSHRGPYRWSQNGLEYIGLGIEDLVSGPTTTLNLAATKVISQVVYYSDRRQVWFWWAVGNSNDPNMLCIYDVVKGAWSRTLSSDALAHARASTMFANTLGATMSSDLKPYIGQYDGNNLLWKAGTGTDDAGTPFQSYVILKTIEQPGSPGYYCEVGNVVLTAIASSGVTITCTVSGNYGVSLLSATGTASLTPSFSETRVTVPLLETSLSGDLFAVTYQIGDSSGVANSWTLDQVVIPVTRRGMITG